MGGERLNRRTNELNRKKWKRCWGWIWRRAIKVSPVFAVGPHPCPAMYFNCNVGECDGDNDGDEPSALPRVSDCQFSPGTYALRLSRCYTSYCGRTCSGSSEIDMWRFEGASCTILESRVCLQVAC